MTPYSCGSTCNTICSSFAFLLLRPALLASLAYALSLAGRKLGLRACTAPGEHTGRTGVAPLYPEQAVEPSRRPALEQHQQWEAGWFRPLAGLTVFQLA